jgi:hypothetical protein
MQFADRVLAGAGARPISCAGVHQAILMPPPRGSHLPLSLIGA